MSLAPFAAILLAGGRSRRMGRDKALLPLPDGRLLWQRQLDVLRALVPAGLFISGPMREGFPSDVPCLPDAAPAGFPGPLAGIAAGLKAARAARLVVLAVDLPRMTSDFLRALLAHVPADVGMVPQNTDGFFEPLAAVYPQRALALAEGLLRDGDRALQTFVRHLIADGMAEAWPIASAETELFTNWNSPDDLPTEGIESH